MTSQVNHTNINPRNRMSILQRVRAGRHKTTTKPSLDWQPYATSSSKKSDYLFVLTVVCNCQDLPKRRTENIMGGYVCVQYCLFVPLSLVIQKRDKSLLVLVTRWMVFVGYSTTY